MRRRTFRIALLCFSAIAALVILSPFFKTECPVEATIVRIAEVGAATSPVNCTKEVTVEFRRRVRAWFTADSQMQIRIAGRWQKPESFPELGDGRYLLAGTNCQQVVFTVPARAEACRFLLRYRVGSSPYCRTYFFLNKYGLRRKFPKLCDYLLDWVPKRPKLRQAEVDLMLPVEPITI